MLKQERQDIAPVPVACLLNTFNGKEIPISIYLSSSFFQMPSTKKQLRICSKGHRFYKSSSCPVCPRCEKEKTAKGFLSLLAAPARRALENAGIRNLKKLSTYSETRLLQLHGMGPASIPKLRSALAAEGLSFRNKLQGSRQDNKKMKEL